MSNRITAVLELLGFKEGTTQVNGFRQSIAQADTTTKKFKAGMGSVGQSIKANMGLSLATAGTAAVAYGIKAVGAFTNTAKAAIDMGAATGLAREDASRWIAVGDDFGRTAEQLTSGIGKIGKTLDSGKWEQYGVATRDAAGNARNANDVLIDSLAMLGKITNETERARVGNELFGKGYINLAPMVGKTAAEYRKMLGAVEDGQVITAAEAKKAERMRLAQDALSDALNEVTLSLGEAVAGMGPAIEQTAKLVETLTKLGNIRIPGMPEGFNLMSGQLEYADAAWKVLSNTIDTKAGPAVEWAGKVIRDGNAALQAQREDAAAAAFGVGKYAYEAEELASTLEDSNYQTERAAEAASEAALATAAQEDAVRRLLGVLDVKDATADLQQSFTDMNTKVREAYEAWANHSDDAITKTAEAEQAVRDHNRAVIEFAANILHMPAERITDIQARIDAGDLAGVEADLEWLARTRSAFINVTSNYSDNGRGARPNGAAFAEGGFTGRGGKNEIAGIVHKGEYVLPSDAVNQSTGQPKSYSPTIVHTSTGGTIADTSSGQSTEDTAAQAKADADQAAREAVAREDEIQAAMYETGNISIDAYRKYLEGRQASTEQYSADWMQQWRALQQLREEEAAQQKKLADEEADRQDAALKAREDAAKAVLDSIRKMYDQAHALQALQRAERDVADALDDVKDAQQDLADAENDLSKARTSDDRDRAQNDIDRARETISRSVRQAGEEMFSGAGARAEANGFQEGTVEWARFVRREVEQAIKDYPQLASVLSQLLVGVPKLASGGVVKARPGGTLITAGEGRFDEVVVPLDGRGAGGPTKVYNIEVKAFDGRGAGAAVVNAIKEYELANGKVFSNR